MTTRRLTPQERETYALDGFIHVPGLLTPEEAAAYRAEVHALAERQVESDATWASVKGAGTSIIRSLDVHFKSAAFTRLLVDPRLTGIAQDIIGPNVQLHHSKIFIRPRERGSPVPMHQDYPRYPHERHSMITAILHFDDATEQKGCLRVYPGTHRLGPIEAIGIDHHVSTELYPIAGAAPVPARAGDAIFLSYLLVHGSGVNVSDEPRTSLLIQMRDPEDEPLAGKPGLRGEGMMLAGIDPRHEALGFAREGKAA